MNTAHAGELDAVCDSQPRQTFERRAECDLHLESGKMEAQARMGAYGKRQVRDLWPRDVEVVGIRPSGRIPIGGVEMDHEMSTGGHVRPAEFGVFGDQATG